MARDRFLVRLHAFAHTRTGDIAATGMVVLGAFLICWFVMALLVVGADFLRGG